MYYSLFLQMGKWSNSYLFFRRTLKWDIKEYSAYITAYGLLGMVATYLLMPFLTDYLKLRDTTILMVRLKSRHLLGIQLEFLQVVYVSVERYM